MRHLLFMMLMWVSVIGLQAHAPKKSWIHFRPHLYVGFGSMAIISEKAPVYETIDEEGIIHPGDKVLKSKGLNFHGQARISLVEMGNVAFGYTFWGYRHRYENDYPEIWYGLNRLYPYKYDLSCHAGFIQYNLPFFSRPDGHVSPFICAGAGPFYGSSSKVLYFMDDVYGDLWQLEIDNATYEGWAWMAGAGTVVYRYGYAYIGCTNFLDNQLPGHLFLEIIIGIRL